MLKTNQSRDIEADAFAQALQLCERIAQGVLPFDEAVRTLADSGAVLGVAKLLADRLGLTVVTIHSALANESDEPAIVACRAAGMTLEGYSAVLAMRRRNRLGFDQDPTRSLKAYRRLTPEGAKSLVPRLETACGTVIR